jgi:TPR repeat protein
MPLVHTEMRVVPRLQFLGSRRSLLSAFLTLVMLTGASADAATEKNESAGQAAAVHLTRLQEDAEQGSPLAQYLLGAFYQLGEVLPQDYSEAANWYGRAADQGLAVAQFALGTLYVRGEGVPGDVVHAYKWLILSATHAAQITGGERLAREAQQLRDDVAQRMTPSRC